VLAYLTIFLFGGSVVTHFLLRRENKKRINGERDHWMHDKTPEQMEVIGDKRFVGNSLSLSLKLRFTNSFVDRISCIPFNGL
jgi:hypothetical protein